MLAQVLEGDTAKLVRAAQEGDPEAARALMAGVQERVLHIVRRRMGTPLRGRVQSADVAHSALGDAIAGLDQFEYRGEGALIAWLSSVVENKLRREARALGRDPAPLSSPGMELESPRSEAGPATEAARRDDRDLVLRAMSKLSSRHRRLIELRDLEGLPWSEVVEHAEEASLKAAQGAHARARVLLASLLTSPGATQDDSLHGER